MDLKLLNKRVILVGIPVLILYRIFLITYMDSGSSTDWIYHFPTFIIISFSLITVVKNTNLTLIEKVIWIFGLVFITIIVSIAYYNKELKTTKTLKPKLKTTLVASVYSI